MSTAPDKHLSSRCSVCTPLIEPPNFCSAATLQQSSSGGCTTCTLLYSALSEKYDLNDPTIERVDSIGGYGFFNLVAGPAKPRFTTGSLWDHISVTLALDGEGYCAPSLGWLPVLKKSPVSRTKERDIQLIKDRFEGCHNHPECSNFHSSHFENLPTRVIDVGLDGRRPFLHLSHKGEKGRFLALSHRWGDPKSSHKKLLTLTENINSHCKGIPLDEFPKTFREAIEVARGLGIQYIWIDSLCIIQNDAQDWEAEASRMADVYSNAFATIFADRAIHSDDGLFQNEKDRKTPRSVRILEYKDEESQAVARVLVQTQINTNTANFATELRELFCQAEECPSHLTGRGWIFQEECLSQRQIHFTETEMKWKCPTVTNCDCGLRQTHDLFDPTAKFASLVQPQKAADLPWNKPTWLWQSLVEHYTTRSLSYETDRIIALAGMAAKVPQPRQDYLGGLWRGQLGPCIFWKVPGPCRRSKEYVAPSWSWASVSGKVRFQPLSNDTRFVWEIVEVKCLFSGRDGTFGKVSSAHIKVRSKFVSVSVEERHQNMIPRLAQERWDTGDAMMRPRSDGVKYLTVMPVRMSPERFPPPPTVLELDVQSDWDRLLPSAPGDLRLLLVALSGSIWDGHPAEHASCLLLRRSPKDDNSWERVCNAFLKGPWKLWKPYSFDEEIVFL